MNKYILAGLCLLAFVAGGVAQLALHRSGGKSARAENVAEMPAAVAAPEVTEKPAEVPAQVPAQPEAGAPAQSAEAVEAEVVEADAEMPSETAESGDGPREEGGAALAAAGSARGRSQGRARRVAYRSAAPRGYAVRRAAPAPRPASVAVADEGPREKAASGAKKTGKWLSKGLKKIGGVFHD